jgi:hypothetical protein
MVWLLRVGRAGRNAKPQIVGAPVPLVGLTESRLELGSSFNPGNIPRQISSCTTIAIVRSQRSPRRHCSHCNSIAHTPVHLRLFAIVLIARGKIIMSSGSVTMGDPTWLWHLKDAPNVVPPLAVLVLTVGAILIYQVRKASNVSPAHCQLCHDVARMAELTS